MLELSILFTGIIGGTLGAILGLGGGIIIIPALTLIYGYNIRYAIGASIVSVIATSSGAAATYVKDRITNIRLAIFLEIATSLGALVGVVISTYLRSNILFILFGLLLLHSAYLMWRKGERKNASRNNGHPWAHHLKLHSSYPDAKLGREIAYFVENVPLGFLYMLGAGILSGLLGIGSGILKVLAMDTAMGLPIKVSSATSNFMIGVTAAAGAGAYFMRGDIVPELAAPVALGVLVGSWIGTYWMARLPSAHIRRMFVLVLLIVSVQMILRGFGVAVR